MNFANVEAFLMIVEKKSISAAAEALYLAQPTVSGRLKNMEKELDRTLILRDKGNNSIKLTQDGIEFLKLAEKWVSLNHEMELFKDSEPIISLNIAASHSINSFIVNSLYNSIAIIEKNTTLNIATKQSVEIPSLIESKDIDIGFTYMPVHSPNFSQCVISVQDLVLIENSPYTRKTNTIDPKKLDPRKEIIVLSTNSMVSWHDENIGVNSNPFMIVDSLNLVEIGLENEGCYAIVPQKMADKITSRPYINMYNLKNKPAPLSCYMVTARHPTPISKIAIDVINKHLRLLNLI